ncbi:MAG: galactokinase [Maribacter sp.]|nr:galactokinase [Maribacter sp.]
MQFLKNFRPELIIESPGRINLIGEHTDYNLGYVLPTAIEKHITFSFQKNGSISDCNFFSKGWDVGFKADLKELSRSSVTWENYVLGVLFEITKRTNKLRGFNCVLESNLPQGSGLSSSAALECGLAFGLNELFALGLSKMDIVKLSQTAEHTYVGTQCGIMDQFASVMSETGHGILLDCRSLSYDLIPLVLAPYKIILLNTGVSHDLATSEYNVRKFECEEGVSIIKQTYPQIHSLREVTPEMLIANKHKMREVVYRRCSFILQENKRVLQMADALKKYDFKAAGNLLYEAHTGISELYEVSCKESDFLVDFSKGYTAVLGARQTGGGFGGCTLHLVHQEAVSQFITEATHEYRKQFGIQLTAFEVSPSKGTSISFVGQ